MYIYTYIYVVQECKWGMGIFVSTETIFPTSFDHLSSSRIILNLWIYIFLLLNIDAKIILLEFHNASTSKWLSYVQYLRN